MAGSQLKRLKASLREQGLVGSQKSKKQKRKAAENIAQAKDDKKLRRSVALEGIREQFNPFQFHANARGPKFDVTTTKGSNASSSIRGRPGISKSVGEEKVSGNKTPKPLFMDTRSLGMKRRQTLLVEMQCRNKVGGILDRRFGEDDPDMTPEEKALQRFAIEKQRSHKRSSIFDLEENDSEVHLTHMGKSLQFDGAGSRDDLDTHDLLSGSDLDNINPMRRKRMRDRDSDDGDVVEHAVHLPERKKTKHEVYKEIIEKSKAHKHERQAAKDADEDLREHIDQEFAAIRPLLVSKTPHHPLPDPASRPATKLVAGIDRGEFDKAYDVRVKMLLRDKRAQPSERTKTDEEKAVEDSARLKKLEDMRLKRMAGDAPDSDNDDDGAGAGDHVEDYGFAVEGALVHGALGALSEQGREDVQVLGLGEGVKMRPTATEASFEDEDDFVIDHDLVASGSDFESGEEGWGDEEQEQEQDSDGDDLESKESQDEFTRGVLTEAEEKNPESSGSGVRGSHGDSDGTPYMFPCPQTHAELVLVMENLPPAAKLSTVIQRIRALYHPKLETRNKELLGRFSKTLVQHIFHLGNSSDGVDWAAIEALVRHLHSLAKAYPVEISREFRCQLQTMSSERPLALVRGDLLILTAIGSIFPTSDHFHRVATPAMLIAARFLGQNIPRTLPHYSTGIYLCILALQYQRLSKRYVPELMGFILNTLCSLAPVECLDRLAPFPLHPSARETRLCSDQAEPVRKLDFRDCDPTEDQTNNATGSVKVAILHTAVQVLAAAAESWSGKPAFHEIFEPAPVVLRHICSEPCIAHVPIPVAADAARVAARLESMLRAARLSRRPLELHHHRPVAIRTYVPKFEDSFAPGKHYDPDRERAELAKLRKEHKKERKGAMRELRKDANFVAREKLQAKKARDEAYETKFSRLVKGIQNEEGHEANLYDREKRLRKPRAKRRA